jgi:hypothetical protein
VQALNLEFCEESAPGSTVRLLRFKVEQEWKIAKPSASCSACGASFAAPEGEAAPPPQYFSALLQKPEGLQRQDFCQTCFKDKRPADVYYFWKAVPPSQDNTARRAPVVDVEYVLDFFKRLDGDPSPQRVAFRYILALMLSRKKLLIPEGKGGSENGMEVQLFREKRGGETHRVLAPELNQDEIAAVSAELGVLLGLTPKQAAGPEKPEKTDKTEKTEEVGGGTSAESGESTTAVETAGSGTDAESNRRTAQ